MSSAPETDDDLTVTVKRVAGGLVSNWFLDHLGADDIIEVTKPAGVFCPQRRGRPAGARLLRRERHHAGHVDHQARARHDRRPVRLLYANRDRDSVIFEAALGRAGRAAPGTARRAPPPRLRRGFLTAEDVRRSWRADGGAADCYVCGPGPFMDLVEPVLPGSGVARERIFIERFLVEQQEKDAAAVATPADGAGAATCRPR